MPFAIDVVTSPGCRARMLVAITAVVAASGCHPRTPPLPVPGGPPVSLNCLGATSPPPTWHRPDRDATLDQWCAQTGSPVIVTIAPTGAPSVQRLLIINWNVHVGGGRLREVVDALRNEAARPGETLGIVLLLQEAYRARGDIQPPIPGGGVPGAIRPEPRTADVEAIAHDLGMSAFYVPSMRNGGETDPSQFEDRGNAVLSTEPMDDLQAIELPYGGQRRVAVQATIHPRGAHPLRVLAAHLDTPQNLEGQRRQADHLARYVKELKKNGPAIVMGADTNAVFGVVDKTVRILDRALARVESCGIAPTSGVARLDFLFSSLKDEATTACQTRFQEYGSDHKPLALLLDPTTW